MPALNISKVAVGCGSLELLDRRQAARAVGGVVPLRTRFRPKRADELIGGSVYWIIKHRLAARQTILGFDEDPAERKTIIHLDRQLVAVQPLAKRAHQGWRYLMAGDAPLDCVDDDGGIAGMPLPLVNRLSALALI